MLANHGKVTRALVPTLFGGALLLGLGGCASEDENTLLVFGPDSAVVLAPLTVPAFLLPPTGSATANGLELISFDPTALDAFGRANEPFQRREWPFWRSAGYWRFGNFDGDGIGWGTGDDDPRLPALTMTSTPCGTAPCYDFDFMYIAVHGVFAGSGYDIYGEWCCAPPGENFVVGFERDAIQVNGELDATQVLLGQPVADPDSLFPIGGSEGGDPIRVANTFDTANPYPAEAGANPFLMGSAPSCPLAQPYGVSCAALGVPDGYVIIDVVISAFDQNGNEVWMSSATPNQAKSVVAPNKAVRFDLPNYNYLTMWHANPDGTPDYSRPLVRYQLGVDLSSLGGPVNNAYAPFPRSALSSGELALGKGGVSRPDSVTLELENLKQLSGSAAYQVWALLDDGSTQALSFTYVSPAGDTTTAASSFGGGEGVHEVTLEYPDNATHIVVSIEGSAGAAAPSNAQILWSPGLQQAGQAKSLDLPVLFGTFGEQRIWAISGTGSGGLFGNEFRERYEHLPRPPVGYKYVGWLGSGDTLFVRLPDETFTSPPPEYAPLTDADVDTGISDVVQPLEILEAFTRICVREATTGCQGPYDLGSYDTFFLTLEPKAGMMTMPAPTRVLEALVPTPK